MASFHTNKLTQGDENEGHFGAHNTSAFSTDMVFKSRQDLLDWVQKVGNSLGYVIVIKRSKTSSGVMSKVFLMCDRGGTYRSKSSTRNRVTKKTNCPFELVGKYSKMYDIWTLRVMCEKHNHEPTLHMEGHSHPYAMRLSANETSLVFDLSRKDVKPQAILSTLKEQNENNVSTIRTIYNARQKFRRIQHAETLTREVVNSDEREYPSLVHTEYTFDANKLKKRIDQTDPFSIRNWVQEPDPAKYEPVTKDTENLLLPRKQTLTPSFTKFPSLQADLKETNHLKDVSIVNPVRHNVVMCYGGNDHDTNATNADDEPAPARPFQPYQALVLNKPEGQLLMEHILDEDHAHPQSQMGKTGGGRERERECQTNTVVELTDKEDKKVESDAEAKIKHDKGGFVGVQSSLYMEEECDHSFILKEDIGYVCNVCGVVERGIEPLIELQRTKSSVCTKTYNYEGRSDKSGDAAGMVLNGVKSPGKYLSIGDFLTNKLTQVHENERNFGAHNTSAFSADMVFKSRQDLFDWVQKVGLSLGYAIVTKRSKTDASGVMSKVFLQCDCGGTYKSKSSIRNRVSKKTNCPFELVGKYLKIKNVWALRVICEKHNHEPTLHMEGHPYAMRLCTNETQLVSDLSRKNVKPQAILSTSKEQTKNNVLSTSKEQNKNNVSMIKTIYNARHKLQRIQHAETFTKQLVNSDERASPCLVGTDPFAIRNRVQELDSAKYGHATKDTEDLLLPTKQMLMPSFIRFPSLQADLMDTNHVEDVPIANPVRHDVVMHYDGNDHVTNATDADNDPASAIVKSPGNDFSVGDFLINKSILGGENEGIIGVHNTLAFSTNMVFKSREDLFDWVQKVERSLGYVIVTKRSKTHASGVVSKVFLKCDRGGTYRSKSSSGRRSATKKTNCPFVVVGKYLKMYDIWTLRVICGKHNHEPSLHMEGHPYAMRLSANENSLVFDLSRKNVKPQAILSTLKEHNKNNLSTLKTIYNARQKFRRIQHANADLKDTNRVNDVSIANPVRDAVVMYYGGNDYDTNAPDADDEPASARPFQLYQDVFLNKPEGQFLMEQFLGGDCAHIQSLMAKGGGGKERESQTNTAVESTDKGECVGVKSNSDAEEDDSQYDVNFDGLADIWKEMTVGLESSKDADMDLSINQHAKKDEEECDHSFILKEDIGYVCRVCGVVQRSIESIIEFQRPKSSKSTKTYFYKGQSDRSRDTSGIVLDGVKLPGKDLSLADISVHPRHKKQMKPHQVEGFNFLLSNLVTDNPGGCILAHAPGSGKTFMLISFIQSFMAKYPDARPLVVLPRGILTTWKKEFKRWQVEDIPLFDFYSQKADNRVQQLEVLKEWANTRSILFLGYKQFSTIVCDDDRSSVSATCREILLTFPSLVILDEGHTPRNKDTDVFTAVEKVQTPRKVVLSGTLYQNHVQEVFNILNLVRPRFLRKEDSKTIRRRILSRVSIETRRNLFKKSTDNQFCELVEHTLLKDDNFKRKVTVIEDLRELTRNVLHYYKGDFLDELPGHVDFSVFLNLSPRQKLEVFELKKLARKFKVSSDGSAIYVHPDLKSLVKTVTQDKNDDDAIKIDEVLEKLDVREGVKAKFFLNLLRLCTLTGEKLLVIGQYLLPLNFLLRLTMKVKEWRLNKEIFMITGDHGNEEREMAMDQFNNSSEAKVFFGSIKACGEGISLVGASRIIILDVHLNPSVTRQAIGRAFRPGQARKVYTYRLVAAGSPEEEDHTTCHRKESIAKMWFEYNEYCGQNAFEMEKIDIKDCGDQFLETPWLNEDVAALYKRS